jgi:hypothetical protein
MKHSKIKVFFWSQEACSCIKIPPNKLTSMETMEAFAKVAKMRYQTTSHFDGWVIGKLSL